MLGLNRFLTAVAAVAALALPAAGQAPTANPITPTEEVNVLVPPASGGDFEGNVSIVRSDSVTIRNDYTAEVFPLVAEGLELRPYLRALVEPEGGRVEVFIYKDPVTGERNHHIMVVYPEFQREAVHRVIEMLNRPGATSSSGGVRRHMRVRNRLASEIRDILRRTEISGDGFAEADDFTNTLTIRDSASDGHRALEVAQYYDVPPRMVDLEVEITEVDVSDSARLGLDWDAWKTSLAGFAQLTSASRSGLGGEFVSFDSLLTIDATTLARFLNYLVSVGHATTVARTTLSAINGSPATLSSFRPVPKLQYLQRRGADPVRFVDEDAADDADTDALLASAGSLRNDLVDVGINTEGFTIVFTPTIGTETMRAAVDCEVRTVVGENDLGEPLVGASHVSSVITLLDNQPCLIGAFHRSSTREVQRGFPLLRRIPYLGPHLFSVTGEEVRDSKLVVLVTPRVNSHVMYTDEVVDDGHRVPGNVYEPYYQILSAPPTSAEALAVVPPL